MNEAAREDKLDVRDIKLEDDNVNLNDDRTISERLPKECDPLEESNGGNLLELENSLKCDIKIEESVAGKGQCTEKAAPIETAKEKQYKIGNCKQEELEHDINGILGGFLNDNDDDINRNHAHGNEEEMQDFDKNDLVTTGRLSRASDQHDEKETSLEKRQEGKAWQRKQGMYKICNIKQEDLEEDNGIIGGFLDDCDDDSPQNEHDIEKQLLGHFEDHQTQIERTRRIKIEQNLTVNSTTAKPFTEVSSDKQCPPSVKSRPKIFYKRQEMSQNYATDANLERNVLYDASTILHTEIHSDGILQVPKITNENGANSAETSMAQLEHCAEENIGVSPYYTCVLCKMNFTASHWLAKHEEFHFMEGPSTYSCDVCGKSFPKIGDLNLHAREHRPETPFSCEFCGKRFRFSNHCNQHRKSIHAAEKLYWCEICKIRFMEKEIFEVHRCFSCDICGKSFKSQNQFQTHTQSAHSADKPYSCDICKKSFKCKQNLVGHTRIHTGEELHSCDVCGKSFSTKGNLKEHQIIHTGKRPFSCDICGKSFKSSKYSKQHRRKIHFTEYPSYSCGICKKSFKENRNLQDHARIHTL